jgi:hypothetical protein
VAVVDGQEHLARPHGRAVHYPVSNGGRSILRILSLSMTNEASLGRIAAYSITCGLHR